MGMQVEQFLKVNKGSRKKKVLFFMAGPLRPNPPSSLMAFGTLNKKVPKKVIFSLMARPFTPPPPPILMTGH